MERFVTDETDLRKLKFLSRESGIDSKYSILQDFKQNAEPVLFKNAEKAPTTVERLAVFKSEALVLAETAALDALEQSKVRKEQITDIIVVSCTGIYAPGLEIDLAYKLGFEKNIKRHGINFLGCYAAFHGLRLADMICKSNANANVLLVCVELCSLHFRNDSTDDNLLSITLFGDGASALVISNNDQGNGLAELIGFDSVLIPEGKADMSWNVGNEGFEMVLNRNVPKHIENNIARAFEASIASQGFTRSDIDSFAIHPGGKNVLKAFARALGQEESALASSFEVLKNFGNMSSCTVLFVLENVLKSGKANTIFSAAFGPGLTVESAIIKAIKH